MTSRMRQDSVKQDNDLYALAERIRRNCSVPGVQGKQDMNLLVAKALGWKVVKADGKRASVPPNWTGSIDSAFAQATDLLGGEQAFRLLQDVIMTVPVAHEVPAEITARVLEAVARQEAEVMGEYR